MKTIIIDGKKIWSLEDLRACMEAELTLPAYYGHNLDALYDILTTLEDPLTVVILHAQALPDRLGMKGNAFLKMLQDASRENPGLLIEM